MLPYAPDWRWLQERADTPWYPSPAPLPSARPPRLGGDLRRGGRGARELKQPRGAPRLKPVLGGFPKGEFFSLSAATCSI